MLGYELRRFRLKPVRIQVISLLLALGSFCVCWGASSENYVLKKSSLSAVGFESSSENYVLRGTLGQATPVGSPSSESYDLRAGFYRYFKHIILLLGDIDGDITAEGKVDFEDLAILADQWLQTPGNPSADIAPLPVDGIVNFMDFAALAEHWLECTTP